MTTPASPTTTMFMRIRRERLRIRKKKKKKKKKRTDLVERLSKMVDGYLLVY
jgi:hypothetical protein